MASRPECLGHSFLSASEDVRTGAHSAPYEDWLARQLIVDRNEGVVGREGAGRALEAKMIYSVHDLFKGFFSIVLPIYLACLTQQHRWHYGVTISVSRDSRQ